MEYSDSHSYIWRFILLCQILEYSFCSSYNPIITYANLMIFAWR